MELEFVSITVKDMDRALEFYTEFFGKEPERRDNRLSFFDLRNVKFSLWNASEDGAEVEFGENCVATFHTDDLEAEHKRLEELAPEIEEIIDVGSYRLFHFKDTEGNLMEVYEGEK